ncbi:MULTISPECIES: hypothetical protein [unclassified Thioalkalivibrio]|uniref:hypothetical protein n=1 Tax=unclassified Thioalkalivibrio TaxID=2621013 RepID=UPI0003753F27|nr:MULTISPECIES: hypothetical protein [unclassified Thioalkalivibrio]
MSGRFLLPAGDAERGYPRAQMAVDALREAAKRTKADGRPQEVIIREWQPPRTDPQRKTLWMWHGEVAAELSIRTSRRWAKEDVHEVIFIPRFMPPQGTELVDPETGEILSRNKRTSEATKPEITEAMERYMAWCYQMEIEITVPEEGW